MTEPGAPSTPPSAGGGGTPPKERGNFWSRRSRRGKILLVLAGILALFLALGAFSESPDEVADEPAATTEETPAEEEAAEEEDEPAEEEAGEEEPPAPPPPTPQPPPPVEVSGSGSRVVAVRLRADSPLVVTAQHSGSSNFIVEMRGRGGAGDHLLFNEIGSYRGQTAVADANRGGYRASIDADGSWTLRFEQPQPPRNVRNRMPGRIQGNGAQVVRVRSEEDLEPIVIGRHRGQSNFIVELIGYGDLTGSALLFNEIGNFQGETLADELPAGDYLLSIQADGAWSIQVRR